MPKIICEANLIRVKLCINKKRYGNRIYELIYPGPPAEDFARSVKRLDPLDG